ncbi:MAG: amidase family protein [Nocardioides sp.]
MMRAMPVRIVADGVVTRSVRDTAAFLREAEKIQRNLRLPPVGDITHAAKRRLRVAVVTTSPVNPTAAHVTEQTLKTAGLLEELGHQVTETTSPMGRDFADDFLVFWSMLALTMLRTGRMSFGPSWDRAKVDNLTVGLERHCARNLHRYPGAVRRLRRSATVSERFFADYDVLLTPTLAHETPRVGHLDPMNDFETTMGRLLEWVAFTPYQNATGEPAISLPLGEGAEGLPLGMMLGAPAGHEATLLGLAYELEAARPWRRIQDA